MFYISPGSTPWNRLEGYCAQKLALDRDVELFAEEGQIFHHLLVSYGENEAFSNIFGQYMYRIKKFADYSLSKEGRMEQTLAEHEQILEAVDRGDGQAAYDAMLHRIRAPLDLNLGSTYQ